MLNSHSYLLWDVPLSAVGYYPQPSKDKDTISPKNVASRNQITNFLDSKIKTYAEDAKRRLRGEKKNNHLFYSHYSHNLSNWHK